ncbi:MAG: NAD-dependent epimerase/dehydratase family protein [Deltaproteobacteria bacterium]|nr:NAD-dependent epimerase/dehydratase family protein [Deltaproteobacteria bacterium]
MRCVVTGAAGFVGSSLCDRLLADGHTVTGIDCFVDYYPREVKLRNLQGARSSARFTFLEENLLQADLAALLKDADWVFHQAAQAGVRASWGSYFSSYCDNNILSTQRLLETAKQVKSIKKIVYASSSSIYGNAETFPTSEKVTPQPVSPYGVTKLAAEHLMSLYATEFAVPTVSLRYFTVYGPRQRPDMAFNRFAKAALTGQELSLFGDGEQSRDFTFISDIVEANILAAQHGNPGQVFNIGGGTQATVNNVLDIIRSHVGKDLRIKRSERQVGDARHTSADTSLARSVLKYQPQVSLEQGIKLEIDWMAQQLDLKE